MITVGVFNLPGVSSGVYTDEAGVQHADSYMIGVNTTTCALAVPHGEAHYVVVQSSFGRLDAYQLELFETHPNVYFLDDQFSTPVFSLGLLLRVKFSATIGPVAVVYCSRTGFVRVVKNADVLPAVAGAGDVIKGAGPASQEFFNLMQASALTLAEPAAALVAIASGSDPASAVAVTRKRLRAADRLPGPGRKRSGLRSPRTQADAPAATAPDVPPRPGTGMRGPGRPSNKEKAAWAAAGKAAFLPAAAAEGSPPRPGTGSRKSGRPTAVERKARAEADTAMAGSPTAAAPPLAPAPAAVKPVVPAAAPALAPGDSSSDSSSSDSDDDVPVAVPTGPKPPVAPVLSDSESDEDVPVVAPAAPLPPAVARLPPGLLQAIAALASASQALVAELSPA